MKKSFKVIILATLLVAVLLCLVACDNTTQGEKYDNGVYAGKGTFETSLRSYTVRVQVHISDNKVSQITIPSEPTVSSSTVTGPTSNNAWKEGKDALIAKIVAMSIADIKAVDATAQTFGESELCIEGAWGESAALVLAVQNALNK